MNLLVAKSPLVRCQCREPLKLLLDPVESNNKLVVEEVVEVVLGQWSVAVGFPVKAVELKLVGSGLNVIDVGVVARQVCPSKCPEIRGGKDLVLSDLSEQIC